MSMTLIENISAETLSSPITARSMPDSDALPEGSLREAHTFLTRRGRINLGMDVPPPPVVVPEPEGPAGSPPPPTLKQIKKALYGILRTVDFNVRGNTREYWEGKATVEGGSEQGVGIGSVPHSA